MTIISVTLLLSMLLNINQIIIIGELILVMILLFGYLTKPFEYKIETQDKNTIMEKIFHNFLITTLIIAILGVIITLSSQDFLIIVFYLMFVPFL